MFSEPSRRDFRYKHFYTSLSKLNRDNYTLSIEPIDFSDLVYNRVKFCRKLYAENLKDRDFILDIDENLGVNADKYYLTQVLDNLIINAISYCEKGKINVSLKGSNKQGVLLYLMKA